MRPGWCTPRRGASRHGDADRWRADGAGDPGCAGPQPVATGARDRPARRGGADGHCQVRGTFGLDPDHHLAWPAGRRGDHPGDQPARSGDHRPQPDRRTSDVRE